MTIVEFSNYVEISVDLEFSTFWKHMHNAFKRLISIQYNMSQKEKGIFVSKNSSNYKLRGFFFMRVSKYGEKFPREFWMGKNLPFDFDWGKIFPNVFLGKKICLLYNHFKNDIKITKKPKMMKTHFICFWPSLRGYITNEISFYRERISNNHWCK